MRVLAFDPGAVRMGFACVDGRPGWIGSGIYGLERKISFQPYKLKLIEFWTRNTHELLDSLKPDVVVSEIVPAVGGGNFVVATQSQLAQAAITAVHAIAFDRGVKVEQIAANTVRSRIAVKKNATKIQVRNGVLKLLPQLDYKREEWIKTGYSDESDAIAIGLAYLGLRNVKDTVVKK